MDLVHFHFGIGRGCNNLSGSVVIGALLWPSYKCHTHHIPSNLLVHIPPPECAFHIKIHFCATWVYGVYRVVCASGRIICLISWRLGTHILVLYQRDPSSAIQNCEGSPPCILRFSSQINSSLIWFGPVNWILVLMRPGRAPLVYVWFQLPYFPTRASGVFQRVGFQCGYMRFFR